MLPWSDRKPSVARKPRPATPAWLVTQRAAAKQAKRAEKRTVQMDDSRAGPSRREDGERFEERAAQWLTEQGLALVALHVQCRQGEIDLIMREGPTGKTAIIVEVRARRDDRYLSAIESIDRRKRLKIIRTAQHWWYRVGQGQFTSLRFDTVTFCGNAAPRWTVNAFDAQGSV